MLTLKEELTAFITVFFILSSCTKSSDSSPLPITPTQKIDELKVDKVLVNLKGAINHKDSINVQANVQWNVSTIPENISWLLIEKNSSQLLFTIQELNTTGAIKTVKLIISANNLTNTSPLEVTVTQMSSTLEDSVSLIIGKWQVYTDSVSNIDDYYFTENGQNYSPSSGKYHGTNNDYYDFKYNNQLSAYENNIRVNTTYNLFENKKLSIESFQVHDTGKLVALTPKELIVDWNNTSPNGGKYYRRLHLSK